MESIKVHNDGEPTKLVVERLTRNNVSLDYYRLRDDEQEPEHHHIAVLTIADARRYADMIKRIANPAQWEF
ncbi:hypothetical protein [Amycolatopsis tucumanensis]|uniref:hypothetical protein n=1 Tax=Amycolatopsis tucumanensis TaxID=401106 RepID=UPI003D71F543